MEEKTTPRRGQRWRNRKTGLVHRVMTETPVDNYVMHRVKGARPCLTHVNEWHMVMELAEGEKP